MDIESLTRREKMLQLRNDLLAVEKDRAMGLNGCTIDELEAELAVYSHLAQAMDDIKLGRVQSAEAAYADILGELENLDV